MFISRIVPGITQAAEQRFSLPPLIPTNSHQPRQGEEGEIKGERIPTSLKPHLQALLIIAASNEFLIGINFSL